MAPLVLEGAEVVELRCSPGAPSSLGIEFMGPEANPCFPCTAPDVVLVLCLNQSKTSYLPK